MYLLNYYIAFDILSLVPFIVSSILGIFFLAKGFAGKGYNP